jgi:hypothetical protein
MPVDPLSHLLAEIDFDWRREAEPPQRLTNIQWRSGACDSGSILFFQRFDDGRGDRELFDRYLAGSPFAVLVINRPLDCFDALPGKGIYVTRPGDWPEVVRRFCDLAYPLEMDGGSPRLRFLGVTGTNGKTTTVKYLESILAATGPTGPLHRHPGGLPQRRAAHGDRLHLPAPDRAAPAAPRRAGALRPGGDGGQQPCPGSGAPPRHPACRTPAGPTSPRTTWTITAARRPISRPRRASWT